MSEINRPFSGAPLSMSQDGKSQLVTIAVLENAIEAQLIGSILDQRGISHRLRSYYDTAYDGLFQMQMGWGKLYASNSHRQEVLQVIEDVRSMDFLDENDNNINDINNKLNAQKGGYVMTETNTANSAGFEKALQIGRPPNVVKCFPNSRALIVSGKIIDRAMLAKGGAIAIAANGRNSFVIRGALQAAQRANAALIIEIAKSEGGASAYCAVNYWNMARIVDAVCNELGITIPVAIHADHYGLKSDQDVEAAKIEIPSLFEAGITSIAIDASHMPDDKNLLANLELSPFIPGWAGLETEIGEIKGKEGLSTVEEAMFLIQGLNAHDIFPDWIALNNGTTHGIEASGKGIQVDLTTRIHDALKSYKVSGAQHGTSGNSSDRLREIASKTRSTKANVATALQMISWGLEVNDYGNAQLDDQGNFIKVQDEGASETLWSEMVAYAQAQGWKSGDYKKLNLPFENKLLGQTTAIKLRMAKRVEAFIYNMLINVFNAENTASLAVQAILDAGSYDAGPKAGRIEDPARWTTEQIIERAGAIQSDKGPEGDFED
jgi:fructose-bisphosphate aldolase class II